MPTRPWVGLWIACIVLAAGCLSQPAPECEGQTCPPGPDEPSGTPMIERDPGLPWPSIPLNESLRSVRLEGCSGVGGLAYVPYGAAEAAVGDDFEPDTFFAADRAMVAIEAVECSRAVFNSSIVSSPSVMMFSVHVDLVHEEWADQPTTARYVFDVLTDSPELSSFLNNLGFAVIDATFSVADLPQQLAVTQWTVDFAGGELSFEYDSNVPLTRSATTTNHLYFGEGVYSRWNTDINRELSELPEPGILRLNGPLRATEVLGEPAAEWFPATSHSIDYSITVDEELYFG